MISIIVPIYNVINYLTICLDSILEQSFVDFELLLIDDGSNDGSEKICDEYEMLDPRIRVFHKKNRGESSARNLGLEKAKGDLIAFIDSDDYVHPEYLQKLYDALTRTNSDIAVCMFKKIKPSLNLPLFEGIKDSSSEDLTTRDIISRLFSRTEYMTTWCKLYKRAVIGDNCFIDRKIGLDIEFNSRVFLNVKKNVYLPDVLYYWVERPTSITRNGFIRDHINSLDCYYMAWENMLMYSIEYQSYALQRLLKVMLYTRYNVSKELVEDLLKLEKEIFKQVYKPFKNNNFISWKMKVSLLIFYHLPFCYKLFRKWEEHKSFLS